MCYVLFSQETVSSSDNSTDSNAVPRTIESVYIKEESVQFESEEEVGSCGVCKVTVHLLLCML
jgi:hypothetical protein